jgi:hypothetical protein
VHALPLAVALLLALPATGAAHSVIRIGGGELVYLSEDSSSASKLELTATLLTIRVYDPGSVGGMEAPTSCQAGEIDSRGAVIEYRCPATGVSRLRAEVGPSEDLVVTSGLPSAVVGESGADELRGSDAADDLRGREGNDRLTGGGGADVLDGGEGADTIDAGAGDDAAAVADGERDAVVCGEGADRVTADQLDEVAGDCETVTRTEVTPPAAPAAGDTTPPRLSTTAPSSRRVGSGHILVSVRSSEAGQVSASAFLAVSGLNLRVPPVTRTVRAGRALGVTLRLSRAQVRRVRRSRRAQLTVTVVAADRAGNTTPARTLRIRLRR